MHDNVNDKGKYVFPHLYGTLYGPKFDKMVELVESFWLSSRSRR